MKTFARIQGLLLVVFVLLLQAGDSWAILSDKHRGKWRLIGRFKAEATFRTADTPDNNPIPIEAGDLVTQRNLVFVEFEHKLGNVLPWLEMGYFLQTRLFYDSAWDVGPDVLKDEDTRRFYLYDNQEQIDDLKWDADLFIGYLDFSGGPLFLRVGRQVMSWGEMSTLRVADVINPLDTTSLAVDLLERRVPLFMNRTSLALEALGPFSSISLEGYYIPGAVENKNGEDIIDGSPIFPPIGRHTIEDLENPFSLASLQQIVDQVEDDIRSDRYGVRLGFMFKGLELNFFHSRAYSSIPVPFIDVDSFEPIYLTWADIFSIDLEDPLGSILGDQKLDVILKLDTVDVYGSYFNYHWDLIDTVLRGELAYYKNVPKMTPGSVRDMISGMGSKVFLPIPGLSLASILAYFPLGDLEKEVLPFTSGTIATFDVCKYGFGLDRWMKVPPLSKEDFLFIVEYVGSKIMDYEDNTILLPWQAPDGEPLYETEWSNTIIFIAQTQYLNGNLAPRLVTMYEVEPGALSLLPSLKYEWRTFTFGVSYFHTFSDSYVGSLGMLESRNELSFNFTWSF